ncbi:MAG: TerC family protein [Proteobacteria bacterium]|nr:MAG: TerC family protein [Pseudomonadota bacterium]
METLTNTLSVAPTWLWIAFTVGVVVLLLVDLSLFNKMHAHPHESVDNAAIDPTVAKAQKVSNTKFSLIESAAWISIALLFNLWIGFQFGSEIGLQCLTGYLIEKSLSVDNLFVILLVFSAFKIPSKFQHRILFYGVLGAIVMRGIFIIIGAQLLHHFHWILYVFGAILVITAYRFLTESDEEKDAKEMWVVRMIKKVFPVTDQMESDHFFLHKNGVRYITPLFLALVVIEVTDLVFAVDSIPAVFSVTSDAFVAFASNILALLGLRALYFVLAESVAKFRYLKPGLSAILGFIGVKMLIVDFVKIPSWVSLIVIAAILITAGLSSWYVSKRMDEAGKTL